jgi:hypothetical protein
MRDPHCLAEFPPENRPYKKQNEHLLLQSLAALHSGYSRSVFSGVSRSPAPYSGIPELAELIRFATTRAKLAPLGSAQG